LAREVLGRVCTEDVSPAEFPFLHTRELTIGLAPVLAIRVSFTGELGYELYMAPEFQRHVYNALQRVGQPLGMRNFGARALNSLRIEKGYGGWGREYTQDYMPTEAGLQALIRTDKDFFVGRHAALAQLSAAPRRRLRMLAIQSNDPDPTGGETVLQAGRPVARLTSAAFGYTVGHSLGLAYFPVDIDHDARDLEVQLLASRVSARVLDCPPYDPAGKRLRG
jgi:dimethylglycine dehydrogenase